MLQFTLYAPGTDVDITYDYYAYVTSGGDYFDADSDTFVEFGDLVDGQHSLVEDANVPGVWRLNLDVGTFTGTVQVLPVDADSGFLIADQVQTTTLEDGEHLIPYTLDPVALYDNYTALDAYRILLANGDPLEGAVIRVYEATDYAADEFAAPVGMTTSDAGGRWTAPVFVAPGYTYVVHVQKPYVAGPDIFEIIVPS